jgi:hypothetical protein
MFSPWPWEMSHFFVLNRLIIQINLFCSISDAQGDNSMQSIANSLVHKPKPGKIFNSAIKITTLKFELIMIKIINHSIKFKNKPRDF